MREKGCEDVALEWWCCKLAVAVDVITNQT